MNIYSLTNRINRIKVEKQQNINNKIKKTDIILR